MIRFVSCPHRTFLLLLFALSACAQDKVATNEDNGIYVGQPKIYDDRTLQQQLLTLGGRLAQLSGIDQNTLISRLGGVQGASTTQFQAALQANGVPLPGVTTTGLAGTPSTVQTVGTTTGTNAGTTNQTVTTTPSNTTQTVTTAPTTAPAPAPLPTIPSYTLPSTYSASSLDTLNEEMQLSYEMINLQLLLQGSLDDDYTTQSEAKRHVTIGFPISISTPYKYRNDIAEVEVSVCSPGQRVANSGPPTLETILPREKTYNVASLVSDSAELGAGAVIANVVNVGGSFLWSHETYYLVRQQDTVALQRATGVAQHETGKPPFECPGSKDDPDGATPVTFAWQFRPVLGQETIQQGMRQTFAQISFPPSGTDPAATDTVDELPSVIAITTCWRKYDADSGIAKKYRSCWLVPTKPVATAFNTTKIGAIYSRDNGDGTVTVKVTGHYPIGTQVGLGDAYLAAGNPNFENTGSFIRFTAPGPLVATRGARLMSPDGSEAEIVAQQPPAIAQLNADRTWTVRIPGRFRNDTIVKVDSSEFHPTITPAGITFLWRDAADLEQRIEIIRPSDKSSCRLPGYYGNVTSHTRAAVRPYNGSLVEISLQLSQCVESHPVGSDDQYPYVAVIAGREFGLSDAPFRTIPTPSNPATLSFLAPAALVQGQASLKLKRLFLSSAYETNYQISRTDNLYESLGIAVVDSSKDNTTFVVTGSKLNNADIVYPTLADPATHPDSTHLQFALTSKQVAITKEVEVLLGIPHSAPIYLALPAIPAAGTDTGGNKTANVTGITVLDAGNDKTTFVITGGKLKGAKVLFPSLSSSDFDNSQDSYLEISLSKAILSTTKQIIIQPAAPTTSSKTHAKDNPPIIVALPPLHDWKANLDKHASIPKGSTDPYIISGSNLQLITVVRYLGKQIPFTCAPGGNSITISPLPATAVASPGVTRLEIISSDGTRQTYDVTVTS